MKTSAGLFALAVSVCFAAGAAGQAPKDVPANHWARKHVEAVISRGVMTASGGKFGGDTKVTRTELIKTMARFGRSLEKSAWTAATGDASRPALQRHPTAAKQAVTRYELAGLLDRMGSYAAAAIPRAGAKKFGESTALPPAIQEPKLKKTDPLYADVRYLGRNRMIWPKGVLGTPGGQPVTGADVAESVSAVIVGVMDLHTDEPQNREEIPHPPARNGGPGPAPQRNPANPR